MKNWLTRQTNSAKMSNPNPENCFKILVATDIHLGYNEKDLIRGNDSFVAFEEILSHAKVNEVDFILLGGDLFHDTNPSQNALQKCIKLLREYTLGDKPFEIELLSDQAVNFQTTGSGNTTVNYEDPNMNIAYPVFSIHGNHDDPCGFGGLSSMDLLAASGLVNYFGRCNEVTEIDIKPILMKKGNSQLALYGLSHIHDNRLARLFRDSKVTMQQPDEKSGEWFNVMVLHQNRADRGPKNYVPEEILPNFLDLVVWGHEHDCRIKPEEIPAKDFFVTQPGSSVATSLSEGESFDKHVGLLRVCEKHFKLDAIKLKTVRPFVFKSINLGDYVDELQLDEGDPIPKVREFLKKSCDEMIENAKTKINPDCPQQPKLPLVRLRVLYSNEDFIFNAIRFGQQYGEKVANPMDMLKFSLVKKRVKREWKQVDEDAMNKAFENKGIDDDDIRLEDYVNQYFADPNNTARLEVMSPAIMSEMCRRLVEHNDDDAVKKIIDFTKKKACDYLNEKLPDEDDIDDALEGFRAKNDENYQAVLAMLGQCDTTSSIAGVTSTRVDDADNAEKENTFAQPASSASSKRVAAATSTAPTRGRGRAAKAAAAPKATTGSKKELNISVTRKTQPTIQQAMSSTLNTRQARSKPVIYSLDSDDSE